MFATFQRRIEIVTESYELLTMGYWSAVNDAGWSKCQLAYLEGVIQILRSYSYRVCVLNYCT